jgi:hypothetical protein
MDIEAVREQFDLPRLEAFNKYTKQFPPQHMLVAAYFGYGKSQKEAKPDDKDLAALMAAFPEVTR